jgi:hypothetical protein
MCLDETYNKVRIGKYLSDNFPIQNDLKQGDALSPLLFNFALEYAIRKVKKYQVGLKNMGDISHGYMPMILIYRKNTHKL